MRAAGALAFVALVLGGCVAGSIGHGLHGAGCGAVIGWQAVRQDVASRAEGAGVAVVREAACATMTR